MITINNPNRLQLYYARYEETSRDIFESGLDGWEGDVGSMQWHKMTIDSNEDQSSGLIGGLALDSAGCYEGGVITKEVTLDTWGEIVFEHYVQNPDPSQENVLIFSIDGVEKLKVSGPSPWQRCEPIGISPGDHELKFEYRTVAANGRKGVIDTIVIHESKKINGLIGEYTPPTPSRNLQEHSILRGFSRVQQMKESDTEIEFQIMFNGLEYQDFLIKSDGIFYFVDEFQACYRGTFPNQITPKQIAVGEYYSIDVRMICPQKVGVGFV